MLTSEAPRLFLKTNVIVKYISLKSFYKNNNEISYNQKKKEDYPNGLLNIDKPRGLNVNTIIKKVRSIFGIKKIYPVGSYGTEIGGCLLLCIGKACCLKNMALYFSSEFIGIIKIPSLLNLKTFVINSMVNDLKGLFFHTTYYNVIKRQIRIKNIFFCSLLEYIKKKKTGLFKFSGDSSTDFQLINKFLSKLVGQKNIVREIRRISMGPLKEEDLIINIHDLLNFLWFSNGCKNHYFVKNSILPLKVLLNTFRRIIIKKSCINSICYGSKLHFQGFLFIEKYIEKGEMILLTSLLGEPVALGKSRINSSNALKNCFEEIVTICSVIMQRNIYPKQWGVGFFGCKKKILFSTGL